MILVPGYQSMFEVYVDHRGQSCSLSFFTVETNSVEQNKQKAIGRTLLSVYELTLLRQVPLRGFRMKSLSNITTIF